MQNQGRPFPSTPYSTTVPDARQRVSQGKGMIPAGISQDIHTGVYFLDLQHATGKYSMQALTALNLACGIRWSHRSVRFVSLVGLFFVLAVWPCDGIDNGGPAIEGRNYHGGCLDSGD